MAKAKDVMGANEVIDQILGSLSPSVLRERVTRLADLQPRNARSDVSLLTLMTALTEGEDLGAGSEAWSAQLRLRRAIIETISQVDGMCFVEGDS